MNFQRRKRNEEAARLHHTNGSPYPVNGWLGGQQTEPSQYPRNADIRVFVTMRGLGAKASRPLTREGTMDFKPFGDKILAEVIVMDESKGGIKLPENMKKTSKEATIVALGPGVGPDLQIGEKVMFFRSMPIMVDDKPYIILTTNDIIGVFKEE